MRRGGIASMREVPRGGSQRVELGERVKSGIAEAQWVAGRGSGEGDDRAVEGSHHIVFTKSFFRRYGCIASHLILQIPLVY